jgi:hypothetical protein
VPDEEELLLEVGGSELPVLELDAGGCEPPVVELEAGGCELCGMAEPELLQVSEMCCRLETVSVWLLFAAELPVEAASPLCGILEL